MKQLILSCFLFLISSSAFAQLQSKSAFVGTTVGYSFKKNEDVKSSDFSISPSLGYFVSNNWMVGIQGQFGISKTQIGEIKPVPTNCYTTPSQTQINEKTTTWSLGSMVRFYQPVSAKFSFFVEGNAGINTAKYKMEVKRDMAGFPTNSGGGPPAFLGGSTYYRDKDGRIILNPDGTVYTDDSFYPGIERKQNSTYGNVAPGIAFFPVSKVGIELKLNVLNYTKLENTESELSADFDLTKTTLGVGVYF